MYDGVCCVLSSFEFRVAYLWKDGVAADECMWAVCVGCEWVCLVFCRGGGGWCLEWHLR